MVRYPHLLRQLPGAQLIPELQDSKSNGRVQRGSIHCGWQHDRQYQAHKASNSTYHKFKFFKFELKNSNKWKSLDKNIYRYSSYTKAALDVQAVFTAMPLRFLGACLTVARSWHWRLSRRLRPPKGTSPSLPAAATALAQPTTGRRKQRAAGSAIASAQQSRGQQPPPTGQSEDRLQSGPSSTASARASAAEGGRQQAYPFDEWSCMVEAAAETEGQAQRFRLRGDQLFDVICVFIFLMAVRRFRVSTADKWCVVCVLFRARTPPQSLHAPSEHQIETALRHVLIACAVCCQAQNVSEYGV